jgi:hypothetical protein
MSVNEEFTETARRSVNEEVLRRGRNGEAQERLPLAKGERVRAKARA